MTPYTREELRRKESADLIDIVSVFQTALQEAQDRVEAAESYARDRALMLATRDGTKIPIKENGEVDMAAILKDANAYLNFLIGRDA